MDAGVHTLYYYAVDNAGGKEKVNKDVFVKSIDLEVVREKDKAQHILCFCY